MQWLHAKSLGLFLLTLIGIPLSYWLQPVRAPHPFSAVIFLVLGIATFALPIGRLGAGRIRLASSVVMYPALLYGASVGSAMGLVAGWAATRLRRRTPQDLPAYTTAVVLSALAGATLFHLPFAPAAVRLAVAIGVFLLLRALLIWWHEESSSRRFRATLTREGLVEVVSLPTQLTVLLLQREQEWWAIALVGSAMALGLFATRMLLHAYQTQRQMHALRTLNQHLIAHIHPDHLVPDLAKELQRLVPFERLSLWSYAQEEAHLQIVSAYPTDRRAELPAYLPLEGALAHSIDRRRALMLSDNVRARMPMLAEAFDGHLLVIPLAVRLSSWGVIVLERPKTQEPFTRADYQAIRVVTDHLATLLENMRLFRQTALQAQRDGLTGLLNRKHLQIRLQQELSRALRYHRPLSVLMIDLDHFKSYNDTYGHLAGDELLRKLATLLMQNVRQSDVVARYGGEEFVIILPETDKQSATALARRLCELVANTEMLPTSGHSRPVRCTISIGVASFPEDALGMLELLEAADNALYEAKRRGRNRVQEA